MDERVRVIMELQRRTKDGVLPSGSFVAVAKTMNCYRDTVSTLWHRYSNDPKISAIVSRIPATSGRCGMTRDVFDAKVAKVPITKRSTLRALSKASGIPTTTMHRAKRARWLRRGGSRLRPRLTETNKTARIDFWVGVKEAPIYVQQDNAKPHTLVNDAIVAAAGQSEDWNINIINQPPNSPDLNILDLGYFNAIQSLQYDKATSNLDQLVDAVEQSFLELDDIMLENSFLTLQKVMECILVDYGGNNYKVHHINKDKQRRECVLPSNHHIDGQVVDDALDAMYGRLTDQAELDELCELVAIL
ncbi:hypothetical protein ACHHYP_11246 [Achlya hypogyna]|uniref:Tc1-like transposase DDE domain-containing protein n=1 Tax=Achlya hypogyna TaxID=1202772 RepID=A0A1V9YJI4_ACHHY|nr:hypothetical protein ACHHYP_11246 [Achlya hypogyna]